ncbi:MAG: SGNH/GDSL hydrolase family protein [Chthoniobacterales bacterium]
MSVHRIVCFGDSITLGKAQPEGSRWTSLLGTDLECDFPGRFEIFNCGIGGNTTAQGLERFVADVSPLLPALVLIEFGFNDAHVPAGLRISRVSLAEFQRNLLEIMRLVRVGRGHPVLLVNHPIPAVRSGAEQGNGKNYSANFRPYQPAIRLVAREAKVPLIDLERSMRRARVAFKDLLSEDDLHLSRSGNSIYAKHVRSGLEKAGFC